jgi:putative FmdB family regulatory protein
MPLYDYKCAQCGKVTEIRHGFDEAWDPQCPACGGTLTRVFNPASIVFKGSGFYVTDSRKSSESGDSKSTDAAAAKPSETKAEPKAPAPEKKTSDPKPSGSKASDSAA